MDAGEKFRHWNAKKYFALERIPIAHSSRFSTERFVVASVSEQKRDLSLAEA